MREYNLSALIRNKSLSVTCDELVVCLGSFFKQSSGDLKINDNWVSYPSKDKCCIKVKISKASELLYQRGPDYNPDIFNQFIEYVEQRFDSYVQDKYLVIRKICYTENTPIKGYFRYRDFQICPVSETSPKSVRGLGLPEPFVLEVKVKPNEGSFVDKKVNEILSLLSLIVGQHFWQQSKVERVWGYEGDITSVPVSINSTVFKKGYTYKGFSWKVAEFTEYKTPIPTEDLEKFFNLESRDKFDLTQLVVPSQLGDEFDKYHMLDDESKILFERALFWYQLSRDIYPQSMSASFLHLVISLESLIPSPDGDQICDTCKQVVGVTASFKDLLLEFTRGLDMSYVDLVWQYRCDISHGEIVFKHDILPMTNTNIGNKELYIYMNLLKIVRVVLLNWLHDKQKLSTS